jgi:hypothetical protein
MVATGPRPPATIGTGGGDEPIKINIGEGMMGERPCRPSGHAAAAILPPPDPAPLGSGPRSARARRAGRAAAAAARSRPIPILSSCIYYNII